MHHKGVRRRGDEILGIRDTLPDDFEQRLESTYRVDELLVRGTRNPILGEVLGSLHTRIHALRRVSLSIPGRQEASASECAALFDALQARDPEGAERASRHHVLAAADAALHPVTVRHRTCSPRRRSRAGRPHRRHDRHRPHRPGALHPSRHHHPRRRRRCRLLKSRSPKAAPRLSFASSPTPSSAPVGTGRPAGCRPGTGAGFPG
jgi:hypothetical protein